MRRARWIFASLVTLLVATVVAGPSAAQTTRTLTVTPDTGLADGDVVLLEGSGFTPSATVYFCEGIGSDSPDPGNCGAPIGSTTADEDGDFSANYTVRRFITPATTGTTIDCAQPSASCTIGASDFFAPDPGFAFASIIFAPQPPVTLTVTPDAGLVDGDIVLAEASGLGPSGSGFVCEAVDVDVGSFSSADCGAPPVDFTADEAGELSVQYTVRRFLTTPGVLSTDCANPAAQCVIVVARTAPGWLVLAPVTFAAQVAPPPISGTVTDPDGNPVAGVDVWAYTPTDTWVGSVQGVTDAQGAYELTGVLPDVPYRILFRPPSGSMLPLRWFETSLNRSSATAVLFSSSAQFLVADTRLLQGGSILGAVTDPDGDPVPGVSVWAFGPGSIGYVAAFGAVTAADGRYVIDVPPALSFWIRFAPPPATGLAVEWWDDAPGLRSARVVSVTAGQTVEGIDAQLASAST